MAQINLAPGTQLIAAARRRRRSLYMSGFLLLLLVGVIWSGLWVWENNVTQELEGNTVALQKLEAEITRAGDTVQRIESFESRLEALDRLLDERIQWAPVFAEVERLLPPATVITALRFHDEQGEIAVSGRTPTIDVVAQSIASLRDDPARETLFSDVNVSNIRRVSRLDDSGAELGSEYQFEMLITIK